MEQQINYTGYAQQPAADIAPDGQLDLALNVIAEDGVLKGVMPPEPHAPGGAPWVLNPGDRLIGFHDVTEGKIALIVNEELGPPSGPERLFCLKCVYPGNDYADGSVDVITPTTQLFGYRSYAVMGNTLIISTASGLYYLLYKDEVYKYLGQRPPFVPISFGLEYTESKTEAVDFAYKKQQSYDETANSINPRNPLDPKIKEEYERKSSEFWATTGDSVYGVINKVSHEYATSKGYFWQPFFVRYAFRLYDGSYAWHSAPVLMLAPCIVPRVSIGGIEWLETRDGVLNLRFECPIFKLNYKILDFNKAELDRWSDIIESVDVFITAPIYTYDSSKKISLPTQFLHVNGEGSNCIIGHWCGDPSQRGYKDVQSQLNITSTSGSKVVGVPRNESFEKQIKSQSIFYKVATFDIGGVSAMEEYARLTLINEDLSNLHTLPTLPDEYLTHSTRIANWTCAYNQRLILSDCSMLAAAPFQFSSACAATTHNITAFAGGHGNPTTENVVVEHGGHGIETINVYTRINGCVTKAFLTPTTAFPIMEPYKEDGVDAGIYYSVPRFLYHPDPNAFRMDVTQDGKTYSFPLKPHPTLSGAYWYGGLDKDLMLPLATKPAPASVTKAPAPSKLFSSEVNNPFIFPARSTNTVGTGKLMAVSTAAKALSQGQFGQFPLYAFTDEGVWALEVASDGTFSTKQPITRDVCINPEGVVQLDSAVVFPTDRGLMLLEGSNTKCITDSIKAATAFNPMSLPLFGNILTTANNTELRNAVRNQVRFADFISKLSVAYDYANQRLLLFAPGKEYVYAYSLTSGTWGQLAMRLDYAVNAYPDVLGVAPNGEVFNLSERIESDAAMPPSLVVTRPFALGDAGAFKTINTIIQRGNFERYHVSTVLYGSRDLRNWDVISSSVDHNLRGISGTPYRYFRLVLLSRLKAGESISAATIQFMPKQTNRLH